MVSLNHSVVDIKLRIYQKLLYLGGSVPFAIWLFDRTDHTPNIVNAIFLPLISAFCLASIVFFRRFGKTYLTKFEAVVYVGVFFYMTMFFVNLAREGMVTGVFFIQKFLLWLPMIHITSFMMFSRVIALRRSASFTLMILGIGAVFLYKTTESPFFYDNFQVFFEIFAANVTYMTILYVIVLLKESVNHVEIRAALVTELAYTDPLTGLFNRRKINELLHEQRNHGLQFSVIMVDVNNFKNINDEFGHDQGDLILKEVGVMLQNNLRQQDVVGRWGGDEFIVICPNVSAADSKIIQHRMKSINENPRLLSLGCSLSFGISSYTPGETVEDVLKHADESLYRHKRLNSMSDRVI